MTAITQQPLNDFTVEIIQKQHLRGRLRSNAILRLLLRRAEREIMAKILKRPNRRYKRWTRGEEQTLCELILLENKSFKEVEIIMLRSERALKLRFCFIVDSIDWSSTPNASTPAALDLADEVARLILNGSTPRTIALQYPLFYLDNGQQIDHLWETVHRRPWRRFK